MHIDPYLTLLYAHDRIDVIPPDSIGPFKFIIMIEPNFLKRDKKITKVFDAVHALVKQADAKMPASWPSLEAATTYLFKRMPWRSFDADNRKILEARTPLWRPQIRSHH